MTTRSVTRVAQEIHRAVHRQQEDARSDSQLLGRYLEGRDEAAFAALVRRHGPMVLGVCRRILRNPHDADDAFQAAFLVLVRKASSVRPGAMLPNWLYGVAYQTARKARAVATRKGARERQVITMPDPPVIPPETSEELRVLLDEEFSRLPDKYRVAIVLCDLEGKSRKEAAGQLGWRDGTLSGRLARARKMLAGRLTRRGLALSAGALLTALAHPSASAFVPAALVDGTVRTGSAFATGLAGGVISEKVVRLTQGVLKAMLLKKLRSTAVAWVVLGVVVLAGGLLTRPTDAGEPGKSERAPAWQPVAESAPQAEKSPAAGEAANAEAVEVEMEAEGSRVLVRVALGEEKLHAVADRARYDEGKKVLILEGKTAEGVRVQRQRGRETEEIVCSRLAYWIKERKLQVSGAGRLETPQGDLHRGGGSKTPAGPGAGRAEEVLGLTVQAVSWDENTAKLFGLADLGGVRGGLKVVAVAREGAAARGGVRAGDVILGMDPYETISTENLAYVVSSAWRAGASRLKCRLLREGKVQAVWLDVPPPATSARPDGGNAADPWGSRDDRTGSDPFRASR